MYIFVPANRRSCIQPEVRRIETDGTSGMQAEAQSVSRTEFQVSTFKAFQLFSVHNLHPRIMAFWTQWWNQGSQLLQFTVHAQVVFCNGDAQPLLCQNWWTILNPGRVPQMGFQVKIVQQTGFFSWF
jgi:hypothetical protein